MCGVFTLLILFDMHGHNLTLSRSDDAICVSKVMLRSGSDDAICVIQEIHVFMNNSDCVLLMINIFNLHY